ncbi:MAG: 6-bladed beta-propeller [Candidatus Aminicenantes bacterium]|nr:6-bladed beta-propeller [Candidatus Aminicenantes bacterium]
MKKTLISLIVLLSLIIACNNEKKNDEKVVVCPDKPLKGNVKLKIEKVLTIDSLTIDEEKPPIFNTFIKDKNGSIYISNVHPGLAVYKFAKDGSFLKRFISKGEGPGELRSLQFLQYRGDSIMVGSTNKIIGYDLDGNYVSEKRLKRLYQSIHMIDKQYFIANYQKTKNDVVFRVCSIINKNDEDETVTLLETDKKNVGQSTVGEGENKFTIALVGITADYISKYSESSSSIYQCLSDESDIYIKNRNGDLVKMVKTNFKNWVLTKDDKNDIMAGCVHFPDGMKKAVRKSLPEKMLAIESLQVLPDGHFAVFFYKKYVDYEIRIFDKDGQFKYLVEFPEELSGRTHTFTKNGLGCIERAEDRDLYVEYKITNLPEIFSN